jgi:hypothetical protein
MRLDHYGPLHHLTNIHSGAPAPHSTSLLRVRKNVDVDVNITEPEVVMSIIMDAPFLHINKTISTLARRPELISGR